MEVNKLGDFIKIDRKILKWEWWGDINAFRLFIYMLIRAYWKDGKFKGVDIKRGSFPSSLSELSKETNLSIMQIRNTLKHLKITGEITSKQHSKFTVFTINNYNLYQDDNTVDNTKITGNLTGKQHDNNTQITQLILKEDKNIKNNIYNNVEQPPVDADTESLYQYKDIIDYLNLKVGTNYKHTSADTRKHIKARYNDGFKLEDFKTVIDKKVTEWKGTDMAKYIRPSTLFGTKFESYLNQSSDKNPKTKGNNTFNNFEQQRVYDYDELEKKLLRR